MDLDMQDSGQGSDSDTLADGVSDIGDDRIDGDSEAAELMRSGSQLHILEAAGSADTAFQAKVNRVVKDKMGFGGEKLALSELLNVQKSQYVIPPFQRPYVWPKPMVSSLVKGVHDYWKKKKEFYYVGNIFVWCNTRRHMCMKKKVLDGQQRLTTLTLLLSAIRIVLKESEEKSNDPQNIADAVDTLDGALTVKISGRQECRLRPKGPSLQKFFNNLVCMTTRAQLDNALSTLTSDIHSRFELTISNAIKTILEFLDGKDSGRLSADAKSLCQFVPHLMQNVYFSHTWIENVDDKYESIALDFFLRVNQNGTVLSYSDTLKAGLLSQILPEEQREEHARVWDCVETRLKTYQVADKDEESAHAQDGKLNAFDHLFTIAMQTTCIADSRYADDWGKMGSEKVSEAIRTLIEDKSKQDGGAARMMAMIELFGAAYLMVLERQADIPAVAKSTELKSRFPGDHQPFTGSEEDQHRFLVTVGKLQWFSESTQKRFWHPIAVALLVAFLNLKDEARAKQTKPFLKRMDGLLAWTFFFTLSDQIGFKGQHYKDRKALMLKAISGRGTFERLVDDTDFNSEAMQSAFQSNFPKAPPRNQATKELAAGDKCTSSSPAKTGKRKKPDGGDVDDTPTKNAKMQQNLTLSPEEINSLVRGLKYVPQRVKIMNCRITLMLYEMALKAQSSPSHLAQYEHLLQLNGLDRDDDTNAMNQKGERCQVEHIVPQGSASELKTCTWGANQTINVQDFPLVGESSTVEVMAQDKTWSNTPKVQGVNQNIGNLVLVTGGAKRRKIPKDEVFAWKTKHWAAADQRGKSAAFLLSFQELDALAEPGCIRVNNEERPDNTRYTVCEVQPGSWPRVVETTEDAKSNAKKKVWNFGGKRWTANSHMTRTEKIVEAVLPLLCPPDE